MCQNDDMSKRKRAKRSDVRADKARRSVFVIMPFTSTPTRATTDLTEFFNTNIKSRIESDTSFRYKYSVRRSDDTFNITEQIIRDLYAADIVICDLSGHHSNPNVMYELGVRLSVTNKPVILIREAAAANARMFDIQGFYAFEYVSTRYRELEEHLITKILKLESGDEVYESPVLKVLHYEPSVVRQVQRDRALSIVKMIELGVDTAYMVVDGSVTRFLSEKHHVQLPKLAIAAEHILTRPSEFATLDWCVITLRPRAVPGIETFLSEPLLSGMIDRADEEAIVGFIARYYAKYFSLESIWDNPIVPLVAGFLLETAALSLALAHLKIALATSEGEEHRQQLSEAVTLCKDPRVIIASMKVALQSPDANADAPIPDGGAA